MSTRPEATSWFERVAAERCALGGAMLSDRALPQMIAARIEPKDLSFRSHQLVYGSIERLWRSREPVDVLTVTEDLRRRGELTSVGGQEGINALAASVPQVGSFTEFLEAIKCHRRPAP